MSRALITVAFVAALAVSAVAKDNRSPSAALHVPRLPFCPLSRCLYYAGDWGVSAESDANALFNSNDIAAGLEGQVWLGIKPDVDVRVTGATVVGFLSGYTVQNPTPFAVKVGIGPGQFGKTICSTSGDASFTQYGETDGLVTYSYTIKKLSKACSLKKGRVYYVNMLPTSQNGYMVVGNLPPKPQNHYGWKNYPNHCYFSGKPPLFDNLAYVPCDSFGSEYYEFQFALTGKRTH